MSIRLLEHTMTQAIAYLNGDFIPADQCKIPIFDLGVVIGASVTDFLRTFNHLPYRMEDHVKRFYRSCKYACIEPAVTYEHSLDITNQLIEHNKQVHPNHELGLVYYMTAGVNWHYAGMAGSPDNMTPTYVQHTFPLRTEQWKDAFINGIHCVTPSNRHWPPQCLSSKIKNRNRLHMWIGDHQVHQTDPKATGLYLDIHGNITETGGSNFVIYRDGKVISPRRNNILWGVSLTVLTEILADMNIPFIEDDLQIYDAVNADEAWLPTTPYCLGPVVKINSIPIADGKPGPLWRKLIDHWSTLVSKNIYNEVTQNKV